MLHFPRRPPSALGSWVHDSAGQWNFGGLPKGKYWKFLFLASPSPLRHPPPSLSFYHSKHYFMLRLARSHVRAFTPYTPSARLNVQIIGNASANATATETSTSTWAIAGSQFVRQQQWRAIGFKRTRNPSRLAHLIETEHDLAQKLNDTGVWVTPDTPKPKKTGRPSKAKAKKKAAEEAGSLPTTPAQGEARADKTRVNIVNADLVKDTIKYLKPTLARHHGCDLISVYPGAGLWSQALHDAVQPRSHLLLEPDEALYTPFLEPLLSRPGVRLIPKSGIIWDELNQVLTPEYLPHQVEISPSFDGPIPRNDTLLVSINLAMYPKRRFHTFESLSRMVLYQLISSMRSSGLFQKYGRVRMLVWIPNDEKDQLLPRVLHHRTRLAIEGELCTEYIAEVCGEDKAGELAGKGTSYAKSRADNAKPADEDRSWNTKRWGQVDMESVRLTLNRMREAKMKTPSGRATFDIKQFQKLRLPLGKPVDFDNYLSFTGRQTGVELEALEQQHKENPMDHKDPDYLRMRYIGHYHTRLDREIAHSQKFVQDYRELLALHQRLAAATDPEERERLAEEFRVSEESWDAAFARMPMYLVHSGTTARDFFHLIFQPPELGPVLSWDRRPYEPLPIGPTDFYPNIPCALLDIQPKVCDPLLRGMGPGSTNSGDIFDLILTSFLSQRRKPVIQQMDSLWPGMRDQVYPLCTSLRDPAQGGIPMSGSSSISVRLLNQVQLMDILRNFMSWPFRPSYEQMLGRHGEDKYDDGFSGGLNGEEHNPLGNMSLDSF